jgi:TPR repeat protein
MVKKFSSAWNSEQEDPALLPHQERVNIEMFRAMELLGKKLERSEDERDRLARRLAMIESSAAIDEKTGKFYLPVLADDGGRRMERSVASKWPIILSLMSSSVALFALMAFLNLPPAQTLTPQQMTALNSLASPRFSQFEDKAWKKLAETQAVQEKQEAAASPSLVTAAPDVTEPEFPKAEEKKQLAQAITETENAAQAVAIETTVDAVQPDISAPVSIVSTPPVLDKIVIKPTALAASSQEESAKPIEVVTNKIAPDPLLPAKLADLEKRSFDGVPEAQHDLATLYASGKIVAQDYKRAVYWFNKAADGGVANADYNLGVMFQQGLGVKKDVHQALSWYQKAATLGHPEAMYNLGIAYVEGVGVERDSAKGVSYFKSAANAGVAQAAFNLGVLYESNFIGSIDRDKALEWYQVAANEGHTEAQNAVERLKSHADNRTGDNSHNASLSVADLVEPAAGEEGEGDSSPVEENRPVAASDGRAVAPLFRSDLVARIQQALIRRELLPKNKAVGLMDPVTGDAIRAWQKKTGLVVDGEPSQELLDKLSPEDGKVNP